MTNTTQKTNNIILFHNDTVLINSNSDTLELLTPRDFSTDLPGNSKPFLISLSNENAYYMLDVTKDYLAPKDYHFITMRDFRDYFAHPLYPIVASAYQLLNWSRGHRYCGVCGAEFSPMNADKSKKCPECSNLQYPQTSVAVITGIVKDGKLLLAHNANFPEGLYSLIAGFVELGENFEETVQREIQEEVGLNVKNIRYFGNQPWPFPNSTMVGFLADYDSGEIKVDGVEIVDAGWYSPADFPLIPSESSIARKIIEHYRQHLTSN